MGSLGTIDMRPTIDFLMHNFPEDLLVKMFVSSNGEPVTADEARKHLQELKDKGYHSFPPQEGDLTAG